MLGNVIAWDWADAIDGEALDVINPSTAETIERVSWASADDVDRAVGAATEASAAWAATSPGERASVVLKLADALDTHTEELARLESRNVGKPIAGAVEEMEFTADCVRFIAGAA